ncbi:MAG: virulence RhuM family protein [Prevotellaceae bacterium]|nr:virulence RhuM family protein [Prevotellaceae bacterium]
MKDWIDKLHGFLTLNGREILLDAGRVSHELAMQIAQQEYDKFHQKQIGQRNSDFDKFIDNLPSKK